MSLDDIIKSAVDAASDALHEHRDEVATTGVRELVRKAQELGLSEAGAVTDTPLSVSHCGLLSVRFDGHPTQPMLVFPLPLRTLSADADSHAYVPVRLDLEPEMAAGIIDTLLHCRADDTWLEAFYAATLVLAQRRGYLDEDDDGVG